MRIIDADKFLAYLIFSKHIDGLTCGEIEEAIEMCEVDVFDEIRAEIEHEREEAYKMFGHALGFDKITTYDRCIGIIDKYKTECEV